MAEDTEVLALLKRLDATTKIDRMDARFDALHGLLVEVRDEQRTALNVRVDAVRGQLVNQDARIVSQDARIAKLEETVARLAPAPARPKAGRARPAR